MNDLQALQAELERERKEKDALKREVEELRAQLARPHGRSPNIARAFRNRRRPGEFFAIKQIPNNIFPRRESAQRKRQAKRSRERRTIGLYEGRIPFISRTQGDGCAGFRS